MGLDGRLRDQLHATAGDDAAWIGFLTTLGESIGATEVVLGGTIPGRPPTMFAPRTQPAQVDLYNELYHQQNALMRAVMSRSAGTITDTDQLPEYDDFRRSDFYHLWCLPQGFDHGTSISLSTSSGWTGAMVVNSKHALSDGQVSLLADLSPMLQMAVERWTMLGQLRAANRLTLDTLDFAGLGALLLDRSARVLDCNGTAQSMLADGRLAMSGGQLRSLDPVNEQHLSRLMARTLLAPDTGGGRLQILGGAGPLMLQCAPFPGALAYPSPQRPALIVIVTDPQHRMRQRMAALRRQFGLTAAEAELAIAVVQTGNRKAAAAARGVSDATARTQLTSIFDKTGVRRQTELVRLLMDER